MIFSSQLGKLDGVSTDEQLRVLSNHLRKMQEELEYRLSVLDSSNINEIDADQTNIFTKGENINNVIATQNGKVSALQQTVDGFKQQVSDYEKGYSEWEQTVDGFTSTVSDYGNKVSQYQQTVDGFRNTVADYTKGYSAWTQTVDGFTSQVKNYTDQVTSYQQTVDAFDWQVQNFSEQIGHALRLDASGLYITDQNGNTVMISGNQIDASTIKVSNLYGSNIYLKYPVYGLSRSLLGYSNAGLITVTDASTAAYAFDLTSYGALRLTANSGDMYLRSDSGRVMLAGSGGNVCQGIFQPSNSGSYALGTSGYKWATAYLASAAVVDSDREKKNSISYNLEKYEQLFGRLRPAVYKYNNGTSDRLHTGFISQDVEDGLEESELTSQDFAGFIKSPKLDENGKEIEDEYVYALRYEEFIALNTHMIQKLIARVEELEDTVSKM